MVELKGLFRRITMYNLLLTLLLVMSAIIVIAVFMQPQKNPSSNVIYTGFPMLFQIIYNRFFHNFLYFY